MKGRKRIDKQTDKQTALIEKVLPNDFVCLQSLRHFRHSANPLYFSPIWLAMHEISTNFIVTKFTNYANVEIKKFGHFSFSISIIFDHFAKSHNINWPLQHPICIFHSNEWNAYETENRCFYPNCKR